MKIFSQLVALLLLVGYASGELAAIRGATTKVDETKAVAEKAPAADAKV